MQRSTPKPPHRAAAATASRIFLGSHLCARASATFKNCGTRATHFQRFSTRSAQPIRHQPKQRDHLARDFATMKKRKQLEMWKEVRLRHVETRYLAGILQAVSWSSNPDVCQPLHAGAATRRYRQTRTHKIFNQNLLPFFIGHFGSVFWGSKGGYEKEIH